MPQRDTTHLRGWGASFSPDGQRLALLAGGEVRLFDWPTRVFKERASFRPHLVPCSIDFSPDGTDFLTCGFEATEKMVLENPQCRLWSLDGDKFKRKAVFKTKRRADAQLVLGGEAILTPDQSVCTVADTVTGKEAWRWESPNGAPTVAVAPDGRHVALGNAGGTIYILRLKQPIKP